MKISQQEKKWLLRDKHHGKETGEFLKDIARVENGEPIDYVIGFSRFLSCDIDLSFHPFIPRPETEFWVEKAIKEIKAQNMRPIRCLDLCAGSGCIGVSLLKHLPDAHVDFGEINKNFYKQIELNCTKNDIASNRWRIFQSNLFEHIQGEYDYIFSNPPYCATHLPDRVAPSVKNFEPAGSLWGGDDGLDEVRRLLSEAPQHMNPGGILYMEFDPLQKDKIAEIIQALPYRDFKFFKDQYGRWRYVTVSHR